MAKYKDNTSDETKEIFIVVTNACNLHCSYCYETNKNAPSVDICKVEEALTEEFTRRSEGFTRFLVNFHGGEPFLAFEKMKTIVEWMLGTFADKDIIFTCTTNGTMLTGDMKEWLVGHKDVFIPILSLDGDRQSHNLNRSDSFDKIPISFFRDNWPLQGVKMTVCPNTVEKMYDNFVYIYKNGMYPNPSLAGEVGWNAGTHLDTYCRELSKIADFFVAHPAVKPTPILNLPLKKFSPEYKTYCGNGCNAGVGAVAFDINGNRYPCHTFIADLKKKYERKKIDALFETLNRNCNVAVSPKCSGCPIASCCSPCYGLNYSYRGDMGAFDSVRCEFNKATVKISAKMFARILQRHGDYPWMRYYSDTNLYHLILGIKRVSEMDF